MSVPSAFLPEARDVAPFGRSHCQDAHDMVLVEHTVVLGANRSLDIRTDAKRLLRESMEALARDRVAELAAAFRARGPGLNMMLGDVDQLLAAASMTGIQSATFVGLAGGQAALQTALDVHDACHQVLGLGPTPAGEAMVLGSQAMLGIFGLSTFDEERLRAFRRLLADELAAP